MSRDAYQLMAYKQFSELQRSHEECRMLPHDATNVLRVYRYQRHRLQQAMHALVADSAATAATAATTALLEGKRFLLQAHDHRMHALEERALGQLSRAGLVATT